MHVPAFPQKRVLGFDRIADTICFRELRAPGTSPRPCQYQCLSTWILKGLSLFWPTNRIFSLVPWEPVCFFCQSMLRPGLLERPEQCLWRGLQSLVAVTAAQPPWGGGDREGLCWPRVRWRLLWPPAHPPLLSLSSLPHPPESYFPLFLEYCIFHVTLLSQSPFPVESRPSS